jgi:hypothetical protein
MPRPPDRCVVLPVAEDRRHQVPVAAGGGVEGVARAWPAGRYPGDRCRGAGARGGQRAGGGEPGRAAEQAARVTVGPGGRPATTGSGAAAGVASSPSGRVRVRSPGGLVRSGRRAVGHACDLTTAQRQRSKTEAMALR